MARKKKVSRSTAKLTTLDDFLGEEGKRDKFEAVAVKDERGGRRSLRVRLERELCDDPRRLGVEQNVELDGLDQPVGRAIIFEADGAVLFGAHDRLDVEALPGD